jgi:hypothetical protein
VDHVSETPPELLQRLLPLSSLATPNSDHHRMSPPQFERRVRAVQNLFELFQQIDQEEEEEAQTPPYQTEARELTLQDSSAGMRTAPSFERDLVRMDLIPITHRSPIRQLFPTRGATGVHGLGESIQSERKAASPRDALPRFDAINELPPLIPNTLDPTDSSDVPMELDWFLSSESSQANSLSESPFNRTAYSIEVEFKSFP